MKAVLSLSLALVGLSISGISCTKAESAKQDAGILTASNPSAPASSQAKGAIFATCHGTEPFWGLQIDSQNISLKDQSGHLGNLTIKNSGAKPAAGSLVEYISLYQGRTLEDSSRYMNVILKKESCSDHMSDNQYSHSVLVLSGSQLLSGCCTLE